MPVINKPHKGFNKAKMYLMQVRWMDEDIEREKEEIERLRMMAEGVKAVVYDQEKVQTSSGDHLGDSVVKIIDHISRMEEETAQMLDTRRIIRQQIAGMPDPIHRQILLRYYIGCQRFEKIASDLNYSYQSIINAHGRALQVFEKLYLQ